jgi:peptidoglycan/xylan/chitin deacetylase (PgdA/CDA1 family)
VATVPPVPAPARRQIRRLIPRPVRQRLYDWSPSRGRRWAAAPGVTRVPAAAGAALTFDDGPDPLCTPILLDALAESGSRATFFVVGERVERHPELAAAIAERGHELALHGMTHRRHDRLEPDEAREELRRGLAAIEAASGVRPELYRPPYGASSPPLAALCDELGLTLSYWTAWGQDWEPLSARRIAALVERDLEPGAVVLLHDSALYAERDDATPTVDAVRLIAATARRRGFGLVALGDALEAEGGPDGHAG